MFCSSLYLGLIALFGDLTPHSPVLPLSTHFHALVTCSVRQIDHPQVSKEVWRSVVSIQRKRAVIACFRQTSLHMMPRYLGIRGGPGPSACCFCFAMIPSATVLPLSLLCDHLHLLLLCLNKIVLVHQ